MESDLTVNAVRMALNLNKLRAEVAGWNIVNSSSADAPMFRIDHSETDALLRSAAYDNADTVRQALAAPSSPTMAIVNEDYGMPRSTLDELVAESVTAGLNFQSLTESLSRHFGLMYLAISGRSPA